MNFRLVATEVGDLLKYDTSVNQIDRIAQAIFPFQKQDFPNDSISSVRAKTIYDWVLSLGKQKIDSGKRVELLTAFCRTISPEEHLDRLNQILKTAGVNTRAVDKEALDVFLARGFHEEINKHAKKLFTQGHFFHSIFEACKAFNKAVQAKSGSEKDGQPLMLEVWSPEKGTLKITPCISETDKNVQNGVKFLSAGLMQAIRNPTAHEPALDWPIEKQDCLDLLSFVSFLYRQLDRAVHFKA